MQPLNLVHSPNRSCDTPVASQVNYNHAAWVTGDGCPDQAQHTQHSAPYLGANADAVNEETVKWRTELESRLGL